MRLDEFELRIIEFFQNNIPPFIQKLFEYITMLGEESVLIVALVFIYFLFSKKVGQRIAFAIFSGLLINNSLKGLIARPRPFVHPDANYSVNPDVLESATGYAFPSGHSQGAGVAYTSFGLALRRKKVWIAVFIIIFLVAFSRLTLGVHYPSDAIVGALLGIGIAFFANHLHQKVEHDFKKQIGLYLIVAVIFFPFLLLYYRSSFQDIEIYKDFYTAYGFYLGYIIAVVIERKYVDFDCKNTRRIRLIRSFIALILVFSLQIGLKKFVFPPENIFFDMLRYFLLSFIGLGIYPLLARKWLFCKA